MPSLLLHSNISSLWNIPTVWCFITSAISLYFHYLQEMHTIVTVLFLKSHYLQKTKTHVYIYIHENLDEKSRSNLINFVEFLNGKYYIM